MGENLTYLRRISVLEPYASLSALRGFLSFEIPTLRVALRVRLQALPSAQDDTKKEAAAARSRLRENNIYFGLQKGYRLDFKSIPFFILSDYFSSAKRLISSAAAILDASSFSLPLRKPSKISQRAAAVFSAEDSLQRKA